MADARTEVLLLGNPKPIIVAGLSAHFALHVMAHASDVDALLTEIAPRVRAIASSGPSGPVPGTLMACFPKLEIVSSFGVGYDHVDSAYAVAHRIVVCHTPDVLTEEVADTALGLLIATVRELPQADRYLRAGHWPRGDYPLTKATLRNRTVGIVGLGRIGRAIARRLDACLVPVVYHNRRPQADVPYRYHASLMEMARAVDTLVVVTPGGDRTHKLIDADVLRALGPTGILINVARGSVVDEAALIAALQDGTILAAGLDVFASEPHVPDALRALDNTVLLPHVGSATAYTRTMMDRLVVDNLIAWDEGHAPLTPVPETPWPGKPA